MRSMFSSDEVSNINIIINNKQSIFDINKIQIANFVYQSLHDLTPPCFKNMFTMSSLIHSHGTRAEQRHDLFYKQARTNCRKFATSVIGPEIWNNIPTSIRQLDSLTKFTSKLKQHYLHSSNK